MNDPDISTSLERVCRELGVKVTIYNGCLISINSFEDATVYCNHCQEKIASIERDEIFTNEEK